MIRPRVYDIKTRAPLGHKILFHEILQLLRSIINWIMSNSWYENKVLSRKMVILRIGMFVILAFLIASVGATSFLLTRKVERVNFEAIFRSCVNQISYSVNQNLKSKLGATRVISNIYQHAIKNGYVGSAPNITLPGFEEITFNLGEVTPFRSFAFCPLVTDKTRRSWEDYAKNHVDLLNGPEVLKIHQLGSWTVDMGIYNKTSDGKLVPDFTSEWRSLYPHLKTPVWQISPILTNYKAVMHNPHSMKQGGRMDVIDKIISTKKDGFTDIVFLVQDPSPRPSTILYSPVLDLVTTELLGLVAAVISWDDVLRNSVGSHIPGIHCVVSTPSISYTFLLGHGEVTIVGKGDLHDNTYDNYGRVINADVTAFTQLSVSDYVLTVYPTNQFYHEYITDWPSKVCGSAIGLILFTVLIILLYDFLIIQRANNLAGAVEQAQGFQSIILQELELKRQFVRYISHEIRTPLNTLYMGLDVLKEEVENNRNKGDILRTIAEIKETGDVALQVVNDFLLFDKIQSQNLNLEYTRMNIFQFIKTAMRPFHLQARKLGVTLSLTHGLSAKDLRNPQNVLIDSHKMTQVVRNLLSNSLKFTPKGGKVLIHVRREEGGNDPNQQLQFPSPSPNFDASFTEDQMNVDINGGFATDIEPHRNSTQPSRSSTLTVPRFAVEVIDNGAGISKENQKKLFREVVQFHPGLLQDGGGSGLGMWISYGIMKQHGGDLVVFSEGEGQGTTFTMEIPIDEGKSMTASGRIMPFFSTQGDSLKSLRGFGSHSQRSFLSEDAEKNDETNGGTAGNNTRNRATYESGFLDGGMMADESTIVLSSGNLFCNPAHVHKKRILVVDDAITNRKMLCRMLTNFNNHSYFECVEADNGANAIELIQRSMNLNELSTTGTNSTPLDTVGINSSLLYSYDVILMDFMMPQMNGPEAVKKIRGLGFQGLVIGVTGHTSDEDRNVFLQQGADMVLIKPVDIKVLIVLLEEYFSAQGGLSIIGN